MSQIKVDTITDELGTGAPNFPYGAEGIGGGFTYAAVTGATHDLDYANGNFFDAGTLTADATLTFSNLETQSNWRYRFTPNVISGQWDVSKAVYIKESKNLRISLGANDETSPTDLFFKPDGTKVFVVGYNVDHVEEYNLSTAWDVKTLSYVQRFSVNIQESSPHSLFFKTDGTKMYVVGVSSDQVHEYNLSTAWDVSTASFSSSFNVGSQETSPRGLFFKTDGTKMYIIGLTGDDVNEYNLSTAWSVSTASYSTQFSVASESLNPSCVAFKPDGTKMYVGEGTNDEVYEYDLSTAWSVSTASYSNNKFYVGLEEATPEGIAFHPDGNRMFVIGRNGDDITEYSIGDISTVTLPSSVSKTYVLTDLVVSKSHTYEFLTTDGGTTVTLIGETIL